MTAFPLLAFVFLAAGVVAVPITSRGVTVIPLLHTLDVDIIAIQHFALFGVVMMLLLVGLFFIAMCAGINFGLLLRTSA